MTRVKLYFLIEDLCDKARELRDTQYNDDWPDRFLDYSHAVGDAKRLLYHREEDLRLLLAALNKIKIWS